MKQRILFVSESVTLAQVVRLVTLARALDPDRYELHFACSHFDDLIFAPGEFVRWPLHTLPRDRVERALASGRRLYDTKDLLRYVAADREVLEQVRPALVVGDFRLSLPISCPPLGIPHAALINAYWSPFALRDGFPLPEHPIVELLGVKMAARYFPKAIPTVFSHFAKPVNTLRKKAGLSTIGSLPDVLCHGDFTLYPDVPELVPTRTLPETHSFLGYVPWAPQVKLPSLAGFDRSLPIVYVTLGSSGRADRLPLVLRALESLPVNVLVATAGRSAPVPAHPRRVAREYLPGDVAARMANLVICNGGASTGYQALAEGRPVLGIPYNLDQYLAMTAIERAGAGVLLRSGTLTEAAVKLSVQRLIDPCEERTRAGALAEAIGAQSSSVRFAAFVERALRRRAASSSGLRPASP